MEKWDSRRKDYSHVQYGREERRHKIGHHRPRNPSFSSALLDAICKSTEDEGMMMYKKSREETRSVEDNARNTSYKRVAKLERELQARQWDEERWMTDKFIRRRSAEIAVFDAEKYFTSYEIESLRRSTTTPAAAAIATTDEDEAEASNKQREFHLSFQSISSAASCSSDTSDNTSNWPYSSSDAESLYRPTGRYSSNHPKTARNIVGHNNGACKWNYSMAAGRECSDLQGKSVVKDGGYRSMSGTMQEEPLPFFPASANHSKSKSKSKHYKDGLKKPKQPISPGSKLASFLNSLFMAGSAKKAKLSSAASSVSETNSYYSSERKPASACSSSSRSCLSKTSRGKNTNGVRRSVTFYPTSIIVDEDSRPCGKKYLHRMESPIPYPNPKPYSNPSTDAYRLPLQSKKLKLQLLEKGNHAAAAAQEIIAKYQKANSILEAVVRDLHNKEEEEEEDDDDASCSSSDLFELENLAAIDMSMYQKELPVYETTHLETNKAIAKGLLL
eukprot:Gb_19565 [translate_table: standard]